MSQNASNDVIQAAYSRLAEKLEASSARPCASDAGIRLNALKDAFRTLSNEQTRRRYDASLALKDFTHEENIPFWTKTKLVLFGISALFAVAVYARHEHDVEREKAEQSRIAAEQAQKESLAESERLQQERELQDRKDSALQKSQFERDRSYAEYISTRTAQQQQYEQQRAERDQRAEQQRAENDRRRQEIEAQCQVEADKRKLKELEYQNKTNRPAIIVVPR